MVDQFHDGNFPFHLQGHKERGTRKKRKKKSVHKDRQSYRLVHIVIVVDGASNCGWLWVVRM